MKEILLDSNSLQKDLRIRLPKQILSNLPVAVGTVFDIFMNPDTNEIILRISDNQSVSEKVGNTDECN